MKGGEHSVTRRGDAYIFRPRWLNVLLKARDNFSTSRYLSVGQHAHHIQRGRFDAYNRRLSRLGDTIVGLSATTSSGKGAVDEDEWRGGVKA